MDEPWGVELRSAGCASPLHESTTAALTLLAPGVGGDTTHIYVDGTGGSERGPAAWGFAVCLAQGDVVIDVLGIVGARVCVDESSPWFLGADDMTVGTAELTARAWAAAWLLGRQAEKEKQ